jgi:2-phospho-L-lactate transferase/gluconeogenesis factor (CofD/UPF0052 family)
MVYSAAPFAGMRTYFPHRRQRKRPLHGWRVWLRPGMLIKRWIGLLIVSVCLVGLALAMGLAWIYREYSFPHELSGFVQAITLQFIPHPWRELIILACGIPILYFAIRRLTRSLLDPLLAAGHHDIGIGQIVAQHRFGPIRPDMNIVAIGGGTGLSTLLRGLRNLNAGITAIVTVADDGGSTGRIRKDFDIPAPGDIRSCLVALSDAESTVGKLFAYRFDKEGSELSGHSFGNLFITALTQVTGSFEQAVIESGRVLAVRGRVLPATLDNVTLCAQLVDGTVVRGESTISDLIVLGPGSLYTSVLPNLCVDGVIEAIRWSKCPVVYVCNVATQPGETDHFGARDHIQAVVCELGSGVLSHALINSNRAPTQAIRPEWNIQAVTDEGLEDIGGSVEIVARDLVSDSNPLRHDPEKLTAALIDIARRARSDV